MSDRTLGVLLLNLGGPDSLTAVRPFLYNLFSDRQIIKLGPAFMQKPLAYLISALRHKKTEGYYQLIGGKSPILDITKAQANELEKELASRAAAQPSVNFKVYIGMRYWRPFIAEAVSRMKNDGIRKVIVLNLYPQYSKATTGSSTSKLQELLSGVPVEIYSVDSWYDNSLYLDALAEKIRSGLEIFRTATEGSPKGAPESGSDAHVLFSAHSLPQKFIEEGDPYLDQIRETISGVLRRMDLKWSLSFQSRSGPVQWLEPSTDETLRKLASEGVRNILVVPISFVSDHIETLYEIDVLYKCMAASLGVRLERTESLNTSPLFIKALADLVSGALKDAGWS